MTSWRVLISLNALLVFSYGIFILCYFPVKKSIKSDSVKGSAVNVTKEHFVYDRIIFNKVVFMLIDALRVDFVYGDTTPMVYSKKQLMSSSNKAYVAKVHPPTVTLPRIKAITTGSIPGFVDVVLNFGAGALTEDNIIERMRENDRRVVFYGDDTWLNLFPAHFTRQEGTSSFFVTDYTEVDDNVTRHLDKELTGGDFDMMILHYLGLDHIGHIAGPSSPLIEPKLQEMDRIIEKIHSKLKKLETKQGLPNLLIVCGDHGMSDQGGHGGASESETKVPVMFLSTMGTVDLTEQRYQVIEQTDLCATLSVLLGLPIPQNNIGKVLTDLLYNYSVQQKVQVVQENALQILKVFQHNVGNFEEDRAYSLYQRAAKSHSLWLGHLRTDMSESAWNLQGEKIIQQYESSMVAMTSKLSMSLTSYDMYALTVLVILIWMVGSYILDHHIS